MVPRDSVPGSTTGYKKCSASNQLSEARSKEGGINWREKQQENRGAGYSDDSWSGNRAQGRERQGAVGLCTIPRREREQGRRDCAQEHHQKYY